MDRTRTGRVLTDADMEELADEAERGYDVSHLVEQREKATERPDLPHGFERGATTDDCHICGRSRGSALHQSQAEQASAALVMEREKGS